MNPKVIKHFKKVDPILLDAFNKITDFDFKTRKDYLSQLCKEIVNQQLSNKVGKIIFERFENLFPNRKITVEKILDLSDEKIREVGLSFSKIKYLKALAQAIVKKDLKLESLDKMTNDQVIEALTKIKGIGKWTAEMFLMFTLAREDIFSYGDFGLKKAIKILYKIESPTPRQIEEISNKWIPYRSYACFILWKSLG